MNAEMKMGSLIILLFLCWVVGWKIYSIWLSGSITHSYFPLGSIENELLPWGSKDYIAGTDIYGRSIIEIISCGLQYSLVTSIIVSIAAAATGVLVGYYSVN